MNNRVAVVIPIYKVEPSLVELASLKQCVLFLDAYPILFVCSATLDITRYLNVFKELKRNISIDHFVRFDPLYFTSIIGYNKLLMSVSFYKEFKSFNYMLIYQLDAWVFYDNLQYWCEQGYDYIGAPWYDGWINPSKSSKFIGVGNGGFSLRKIESHLKVLHSFRYVRPVGLLWQDFSKSKSWKSFITLLRKLTVTNNTYHRFNDFDTNEDVFWGKIANKKFKWFKLPEEEIAIKFAWETLPSILHEKNEQKLPFGCHKWEVYEPDFWKQFIPNHSN